MRLFQYRIHLLCDNCVRVVGGHEREPVRRRRHALLTDRIVSADDKHCSPLCYINIAVTSSLPLCLVRYEVCIMNAAARRAGRLVNGQTRCYALVYSLVRNCILSTVLNVRSLF